MEKIRVLFLPVVDAANTNAQSLNVREIAPRLDRRRFDITLLYDTQPDARLADRPDIRMVRLPVKRKTAALAREMLAGYDIVTYMDYSPASYLFVHLPRIMRSGAKSVMHLEAPVAQVQNPSRTLRFLYEGIVGRCDIYTGITDFVARDFEENRKRKPKYILPVGVDLEVFTPPAERKNSTAVVLFAGTLIERKGPQHVVAAAARFPEANFKLVGSGRHGFEDTLKEQISKLGLTNVSLEGPKSQSEMLDCMRSSDIFLLPSRLEGIPKVTLEAAATGLPCIVFRDYQTPSVVDGKTGYQVSTVEEMMQALDKLIGDRTLRLQMGAAAREHVQQFSWDLVANLWQNAYLEIASARAK